MSPVLYQEYHPLPRLMPHEIRYLREQLEWSQLQFGRFLSKDRATISRWESGLLKPDALSLGVLHGLWTQIFGSYEGPYPNWYETEILKPLSPKTKEVLSVIAEALFVGGVAFFIAKGLKIGEED